MTRSWDTQLRKGLVELCVLEVLARNGEAYGYQILQTLSQTAEIDFGESTLYPALARLDRDGIIEARVADSKSGPPRRYYRLTDRGKDRLEAMRSGWRSLRSQIDRLIEGES